jgi:hypothetical protein
MKEALLFLEEKEAKRLFLICAAGTQKSRLESNKNFCGAFLKATS